MESSRHWFNRSAVYTKGNFHKVHHCNVQFICQVVLFKAYSIGLDYFGIGKLSDTKEVKDQLLQMHQRSLEVKRIVRSKMVLGHILRIYITSKSMMRA